MATSTAIGSVGARWAIVAVVFVALWQPFEASATPTTITFDDLARFETVNSQYSERAAFGERAPGVPNDGTLPLVDADINAESAPHVGRLYPSSGELKPPTSTDVHFAQEQDHVEVVVGDSGDAAEIATVRLLAFDLGGNPIANVGSPGMDVATIRSGSKARLGFTAMARNIAYLRIGATLPKTLWIDDLAFDLPAVPLPPTFDIALTRGPGFGLPVARGSSATEPIKLLRSSTSTGKISFSPITLTPGLSAKVEPVTTTGPNGTLVTLRVSASPDAPCGATGGVTVVAQALDSSAGDPALRKTVLVPVNVPCAVSLRIAGIEVSQGIQADLNIWNPLDLRASDDGGLPNRSAFDLSAPVPYQGVGFAAYGKTVVRVFANTGAGPSVSGALVTLEGSQNGTRLGAEPLLPEASPSVPLRSGPGYATMNQRSRSDTAFVFTLPPNWTRSGTISLTAQIYRPAGFDPLLTDCVTVACSRDSTFVLRGIDFFPTQDIELNPIEMTVKGNPKPCAKLPATPPPCLPDPGAVFDAARAVLPIGEGRLLIPSVGIATYPFNRDKVVYVITPVYEGEKDITDIERIVGTTLLGLGITVDGKVAGNMAASELVRYANVNKSKGTVTIGVFDSVSMGAGVTRHACGSIFEEIGAAIGWSGECPFKSVAVVNGFYRPLTSATHELGHVLGLRHASYGCGGGANGEKAVEWPPDNEGWIQGVGIDRRSYQIIPERRLGPDPVTTQPGATTRRTFDFMSYCAYAIGASGFGPSSNDDFNSWISSRNWQLLLANLRTDCTPTLFGLECPEHPGSVHRPAVQRSRRAAAAGPQTIDVSALAVGKAVAITEIGVGETLAPTATDSAYHLVLRDKDGSTVSDAPMVESVSTSGTAGGTLLFGQGPAAGVVEAQIVRDGIVLAKRNRSSRPPTLTLLHPTRSERVGGRQRVSLKYRASDADGDELSLTVAYSLDNGRSWRVVHEGPARTGELLLPGSLLPGSSRIRLRVTVDDGFNETSIVSPRFVSLGSLPGVRILNPARGTRLRNDAALYLSGQANDDRFRPLHGTSLRWYVGRKRVGIGNQVVVYGLKAGLTHIRLTARDSRGQRTTATVAVRLLQARPRFLRLRAPRRVAPRVRRIKLAVASSVPATLTVRGRHYRVTRRQAMITVRIAASRKPIRLKLTLRAGTTTTRAAIVIRRS